MDKVIFLDIDGVLNCQDWYEKRRDIEPKLPHPLDEFCPHRVSLLNRIIEATEAKIIVSSTWRADGLEVMQNLLKEVGVFGDVIGVTPHLSSSTHVRGNEILCYIQDNYKYPKDKPHGEQGKDYQYCIIDDDSDMLYWQKDNFVQTGWMYGLEEKHVQMAVDILNASVMANTP